MGAPERKLNVVTWLVLIGAIIIEAYTYALPVMLTYVQPKKKAFITFAITTIPRCLFWLSCSFYLGGFSNWWKKYFSLDGAVPAETVVSIVYGFYLIHSDTVPPLGWKIAAVVALPCLLFTYSGHVRVLMKYFPFNRYSLLLYRLNRVAAIVVTIIVECLGIVGSDADAAKQAVLTAEAATAKAVNQTLIALGKTPLPTPPPTDDEQYDVLNVKLQVVFIGVITAYYTVLFALTPKWEAYRKAKKAAEKKG